MSVVFMALAPIKPHSPMSLSDCLIYAIFSIRPSHQVITRLKARGSLASFNLGPMRPNINFVLLADTSFEQVQCVGWAGRRKLASMHGGLQCHAQNPSALKLRCILLASHAANVAKPIRNTFSTWPIRWVTAAQSKGRPPCPPSRSSTRASRG